MTLRNISRLHSQLGSVSGYHTSSIMQAHRRFRESIGLIPQPNRTPELHQYSDYSFVDGRPTPVTPSQLKRIKMHRELTAQAVQHLKEIDFIQERWAKKLAAKEAEKQQIIDSKLKPKGEALLQKKS